MGPVMNSGQKYGGSARLSRSFSQNNAPIVRAAVRAKRERDARTSASHGSTATFQFAPSRRSTAYCCALSRTGRLAMPEVRANVEVSQLASSRADRIGSPEQRPTSCADESRCRHPAAGEQRALPHRSRVVRQRAWKSSVNRPSCLGRWHFKAFLPRRCRSASKSRAAASNASRMTVGRSGGEPSRVTATSPARVAT